MNAKKYIFAASIMAAACTAATAQDTMYLVKGDHVVGKFANDAVDYITFDLPDNVIDGNLWVKVDQVGKNDITYTVGAVSPGTAYAHNILSAWDIDYYGLIYMGDLYANLEPAAQTQLLQWYLSHNAYMAQGTQTFTQIDFENDGTGSQYSRFTVTPGTPFFLCAWEIDPVTMQPLESFAMTELRTDDPGQSAAQWDVQHTGQNEYGLVFDFTGGDAVKYYLTAYGKKAAMENTIASYGEEFVMGAFGQRFAPWELEGIGELGVDASTWPAEDAGEYMLIVRAYDNNGDMNTKTLTATFVSDRQAGPQFNVFTRSKADGQVSINFEITPSNVTEAWVNMLGENETDDLMNTGLELWELAADGDRAVDITEDINYYGEYTFNAAIPDGKWYNIIVAALDKQGNRTAQRFAFNNREDSEWYDYKPVYYPAATPQRLPAAVNVTPKADPTLKRVR